MRFLILFFVFAPGCGTGSGPRPESIERARYLRPAGTGRATECDFTIRRSERGWEIASVTGRGPSALTVTARYDAANALEAAEAFIGSGETRKSVRVTPAAGKARVEIAGREPQEFDLPRGVIVTSAPDWTDTFLLCRLHDRTRAGPQEFPGLWIHPVQPVQRLTFSVEKVGGDLLKDGERTLELDRLTLRLRGNSRYLAWTDSNGRMIKLVSLPIKDGGTDLILEGFETSAARLGRE